MAITNILAGTAYPQATLKVDVGYSGTLAFRDEATNSTSAIGSPATTRIHEGDTVQFIWQGPNHNISPYDTVFHSVGFPDVQRTFGDNYGRSGAPRFDPAHDPLHWRIAPVNRGYGPESPPWAPAYNDRWFRNGSRRWN